MHPRVALLVRAVALCLVAGLLPVVGVVPATAAAPTGDAPSGRLVSQVAAPRTPHVLDGRVYSVTQVGRTIVLAGSFTRVREDGKRAVLLRRGLVAFDARSGRILRRFAPQAKGGDVRIVVPAGDGRTVFVGGGFTKIAGKRRAKVARIRIADGSLVARFRPGPVTGDVKDLALVRGRLWLAGAFTHVGGRPQKALATVSPRTGRPNGFMRLPLTGNHNRGVTQVLKIAVTRNGARMVLIGNFDKVAGARRHQLAVLETGGRTARLGRLATRFYTTRCSHHYDSYMRDLDISPDGRWFVVSTTGSHYGPDVACDTVARFELGAVGSNVAPSWIDSSGGDTSYAVEITPSAVYVGGHQRWWNNSFARDRPGPGAVSRPGIAALDPLNGLPLSWNPTRDLGVGVLDFLSTRAGLWVASDTTRIGPARQLKGRIARLPTGGLRLPAVRAARLPGDVHLGGPFDVGDTSTDALRRRTFDGTTAGPPSDVPDGGLDWSAVRGAFTVNGRLYLAHADGRFTSRAYDGTTYGAETPVATADQIVPVRDWADDLRFATGMFFDQGRLYFTRAGSPHLFYRYFSPQSGVVGARRLVAPASAAGLDLSQVRGMFVAGSTFYWATPDGVLRSAGWLRGAQSGAVRGPAGPTWAGDWDARAVFVLQR